MEGYTYQNAEEREVAESFFRAHNGEIPRMSAGEQIGLRGVRYYPSSDELARLEATTEKVIHDFFMGSDVSFRRIAVPWTINTLQEVAGLTDRQMQIVRLLADGKTQRQIGTAINLDRKGVYRAIRIIERKIQSASKPSK